MELDRESWVPTGVDTGRANVARVYDALLGGSHNFAADRDVASALLSIAPNARDGARENRAFLGRAVRFLADAGVRQFLDVGSGVPTEGNVHEIAEEVAPGSRVVYVDVDPVAIAHSKAILAGNDRARIVQADLREPERILADPEVTGLIDFSEPVGLLLVAVLHFITDEEDPAGIVRRFAGALAPGSHLALSHFTTDGNPPQVLRAVEKLYTRASAPAVPRDRAGIEAFFDGFELVEPGVTFVSAWRPTGPSPFDDAPERSGGYAGVGRKP